MATRIPSKLTQKTWLDTYIKTQQKFDADLFKILEQAARDADREVRKLQMKEGIGAAVRVRQLMGARGGISRILAYLWKQTGDLTRAGRVEAQAVAIEQSFDWEEFLLARAIPDPEARQAILDYLLGNADKNIDALLARIFQTRQTLSQQVYKSQALSKRWVENAINSGMARGATVSEIAASVKDMIRPDAKGGVSYAAKRLARTEINNAYHAQSIDSAQDKPWVNGMKWNMSKTHKVPDECNDYAVRDNGLGAGVWPMHMVPKKPHPQCLCYVIPDLVSVAEFNKNLRLGMYDEYMDSNFSADISSTGRQVS